MKAMEIEILNYLNEVTGKHFKAIKSNLKPISARFKDGYTLEEMKEVIMVKTLEWKNNEVMAVHLCPTTLFRPSNFEKYVNQVLTVKQNPDQYRQYYEQLNKTAGDPLDHMFK
jgi:uncharacterized phage protein (TIGR02220 family)